MNSSKGNPNSNQSRNGNFLDKQFRNEQNRRTILCGSSLFQWATVHASTHPPHCTRRQDSRDATSEESNDLNHVFVGHSEVPGVTDKSATRNPDIPPLLAATRRDQLLRYRQHLCAKLHCLYGVPIDYVVKESTASSRYHLRYSHLPIHPYVRSRVYDLRQHTDGTFWGPFVDDGSLEVEWEKLESVMVILHHNMKRYAGRLAEPDDDLPAWDQAFAGASPYSYIPKTCDLPNEPKSSLECQDPYNVTGTWMRVVCFVDYTELYRFNFSEDQPASWEPRPPLDTEEATRLITMKIRVTKIEPPGEDDGQGLPIVFFKGISSSVRPSWDPNANSKIRG